MTDDLAAQLVTAVADAVRSGASCAPRIGATQPSTPLSSSYPLRRHGLARPAIDRRESGLCDGVCCSSSAPHAVVDLAVDLSLQLRENLGVLPVENREPRACLGDGGFNVAVGRLEVLGEASCIECVGLEDSFDGLIARSRVPSSPDRPG